MYSIFPKLLQYRFVEVSIVEPIEFKRLIFHWLIQLKRLIESIL